MVMRAVVLSLVLLAGSCGAAAPQATESRTRPHSQAVQAATHSVTRTGWVTDHANLLGLGQEEALTEQLVAFEKATRHQLVVVTVPSLNGQDISTFTRDLANAWGVGRADHDDGVVLLVAPNERRVRIAVGYGLENRLTDALCLQIIEGEMIPKFRRSDIPGGVMAGTQAIIRELS